MHKTIIRNDLNSWIIRQSHVLTGIVVSQCKTWFFFLERSRGVIILQSLDLHLFFWLYIFKQCISIMPFDRIYLDVKFLIKKLSKMSHIEMNFSNFIFKVIKSRLHWLQSYYVDNVNLTCMVLIEKWLLYYHTNFNI